MSGSLKVREHGREGEGAPQGQTREPSGDQDYRGGLLPLLRLLTREPPLGHDFKTCPVCKRYGIKQI